MRVEYLRYFFDLGAKEKPIDDISGHLSSVDVSQNPVATDSARGLGQQNLDFLSGR